MPFPTPDSNAAPFVGRRLLIPDDVKWLGAVNGALLSLTEYWNWEPDGAVSVQDAADYAFKMLDLFWAEGNWLMAGTIYPVVTASIPQNTLACDGATYNRSDYPDLYDAIDSVFHVTASTFRVPDMRGRVPVGQSADFVGYVSGGEIEHTLTVAELPSHTHTDAGHIHSVTAAAANATTIGPGVPEPTAIPVPLAPTSSGSANIQNTGGGSAHNNMPPYLAVKWVIVCR